MKNLIFVLLLVAAAFGFVACKASKNSRNRNEPITVLTSYHWKLIEIMGVLVGETAHEPYIVFTREGNRVKGNTSCNNFFGTFELKEKNQIKFLQGGMTKMACLSNSVETPFIQAINSTVSYQINREILSLFDANGAVLARFEGKTPK